MMALHRIVFLIVLLSGLPSFCGGQDVMSGCVNIDFEAINGEPVFDGMVISDQYFNTFGLTFSLEDGTSPVIAQVGFPTTAFGGPGFGTDGSDTPAPGVDIGQFFLTDDGVLAGLTSPALILDFVNPLDSIAGCILDIDFDETFIMHARDIDGNVLLADTIRAGDPGTGDGELSCWGFNLEGCEGTIYSLRMEGTRESAGAFGLGVDYLSFCLSGIDLVNNLIPIVENTYCDLENGSITLTNQVGSPLTYSIDSINFQESPVFENLGPGAYTIYVMNENGCTGLMDLPVLVDVPLNTDDLIVDHTTCNESNGSLFVMSNDSLDNSYSIDGVNFQNSQFFGDLQPGDYMLTKVDQFGCEYFEPFTIEPSLEPQLEISSLFDESCFLENGEIVLNGTPSEGNATYSLNGGPGQTSPIFDNLIAGDYLLSMIDEDNCVVSIEATLDNIGILIIEDLELLDPTCESREGSITVIASGGIGELSFGLDSLPFQSSNIFEAIEPGSYLIEVRDSEGCAATDSLFVPSPDCPIFSPNIFCPTCDDPQNSSFQLFSTNLYNVEILSFEIYDRWGNLIFKSSSRSIHYNDFGWDGTFDGIPAELGVYAYRAELQYESGLTKVLHGDITLVR